MKALRYLLLPFSLLYGTGIAIRNLLFSTGILNSSRFDIPTICVGNLSFGGTGKTPHIEYLVRLFLSIGIAPAVLSGGYRRKSVGYVFAEPGMDYSLVGDEPSQIKEKFRDNVAVAVSENRVLGIPNLLYDAPDARVVLLDDAFQHRALKAGLNILLTDHARLYSADFLPPAGTLREFRQGARRADIIVVTKCPPSLSQQERDEIRKKLKPLPHQQLFFSYLKYGELMPVYADAALAQPDRSAALLFSGIAHTELLEAQLRSMFGELSTMRFPDHHNFSMDDIRKIRSLFELGNRKGALVTTEKDKVRLQKPEFRELLQDLPLYFLPLEIDFFTEDKQAFDTLVTSYVLNLEKEA